MKRTCPHCGAKMVEYKHSFSKALAYGLYRLYLRAGPVNIKALGLTRNQWDNFQKLRYWGVVAKAARDDGKRIGGAWVVTQRGIDFVERRITLPSSVWSYRGDYVHDDEDATQITMTSVHGAYKTRPEYAAESRAKQPEPDLFDG